MKKKLNPAKNIPYQMGCTMRELRCAADKKLAKFGFPRNEWLIIGLLLNAEDGKMYQCDLRKYLSMEDSYLTKVLDKLIEKNIIEKVICKNDRRQRFLRLHPNAKTLAEQFLPELITMNEKCLEGFSKAEREQLFSFLERIRNNIHSD